MIVVARVLVPEHEKEKKLDNEKIIEEFGVSQHFCKLAESDFKESVVCVVMTARQEEFKEDSGKLDKSKFLEQI